jgi:CRISPR-associated endonuclease/helicase Cas3
MTFKARYRTKSDAEYQPLYLHLEEVGMYVELFAKKINLPKPALLTGLVHDMGKGSVLWQRYLDESVRSKKRDKPDHAAAGGQFLYERIRALPGAGDAHELIGQLLAACVMYHHGPGLPDVIKPDGTAVLYERLGKDRAETRADEAAANLEPHIKEKIEAILGDADFITETITVLKRLSKSTVKEALNFNLGLTARFLSSCLIDGDRRSSAHYDRGISARAEDAVAKPDWAALVKRLEDKLDTFPKEGTLNEVRRMISGRCALFAEREDGIYTLSAATGAGKTLASLRYALVRAERTGKDHVFIIAPYTSILDQNADIIRGILDPQGENGGIVLEHHSNLEQSEKTEHFFDSSETWNAPIIITTMVQFLESLFGSGTRKIRRMHQLANSVIVFDEIQTLPVSSTYLFIWAIRYVCQNARTSALLCTATQPGLDMLKHTCYTLPLPSGTEIIPDITRHFEDLKRVELVDKTKETTGWTLDETAAFIEGMDEQSILTVVNIKVQARTLYGDLTKRHPDWLVVHLSANMCPAHRRRTIDELKESLKAKTKKCVCISTRLIEAGVDIDFDGAIRFLAGFDSIIQTAGRCNRNGELRNKQGDYINGKTYIINICKNEEKIASLPDLIHGQNIMKRILREYHGDEARFNHSLFHPELIAHYFDYFYGELSDSDLKHTVFDGRADTVLDLLSDNTESEAEYNANAIKQYGGAAKSLTNFRQSFQTAWEKFEVIADDTIGVIVPFERGADIIKELYALPDSKKCVELLREAQQYSVNVYRNEKNNLLSKKILDRAPLDNFEIYIVDERFYDTAIGLNDTEGRMSL